MEELILKHVLMNALEHEGKADASAVIGKIIAERPELKTKIKEIIPEVKKTVIEINSWPLKKQESQVKKLGIKIGEKKAEEKIGLPEIPNAQTGKVIMRVAPFPSGPLHIGNARMVLLNDEYVKKYKGKMLVVIDDTIGSEEKFILPEAYDLIVDGLKWLGVKWDQLLYKSDRMKFFYSTTEELIGKNLAYVCECDIETLRKNRVEGIECEHRSQSVEENLKKWKCMLEGKYREGEAVVRLKTDMKNPNPAFRDRVLMKISERAHPRVGKKYKVWPTLELSWAVDDQLLGITHILRGKQLVIEDMMEEFIWEKLGWPKKQFVHYGMLGLKEAEGKLSKSESRKLVQKGVFSGWDDPRTWSMQSLKKRGIQPEAIRRLVVGMGLSLADVTVPAEILYAENRKIIDSLANRYFAVLNPVEIEVKKSPKIKSVKVNLHPDFPKRGKRTIPVNPEKIFIEREDFEKLNDKEVGLMNLFSIKLKKDSEFKSKKISMDLQKIHWVSEKNVKIKIVMPDGSVKEAIAEPDVMDLNKDDLIQIYRTGFCRVDKPGRDMVLYFAHK
jgi:glutamyl-tRNA synthetase